MMHVDYGVGDDCINNNSYGEICVRCGCCSKNHDYKNRMISRLRYYKSRLNDALRFDDWFDDEVGRKYQENVVFHNVQYYKRKIRTYKKILRCLK